MPCPGSPSPLSSASWRSSTPQALATTSAHKAVASRYASLDSPTLPSDVPFLMPHSKPEQPSGSVPTPGTRAAGNLGKIDLIRRRDDGARGSGKSSPSPIMDTAGDSQAQLNRYRERLVHDIARDLEQHDITLRGLKPRVSPIQEEVSRSPPPAVSDLATASTESVQTVNGAPVPTTSAVYPAATPSFPFPLMAPTPGPGPGQSITDLPHHFPSLSPTIFGANRSPFGTLSIHDEMMFGSPTPASAIAFQPLGAVMSRSTEEGSYPTPNLYELSLLLSAEPGLDAWWSTVVQIMTEVYKAERVSLAVPADATDIENVPWGQRATYNAHEDDDLSVGYMTGDTPVLNTNDGSDFVSLGSANTPRSDRGLRPGLQSRHSFTKFEDEKVKRPSTLQRPTSLLRSKSYFPPAQAKETFASLNEAALQEHDAAEPQRQSSWDDLISRGNRGNRARVLPVLQGFDLEADPLIDNNGVTRVIQRGKVIALTRNYPYLDKSSKDEAKPISRSEEPKRKFRKHRADSSTNLSSILGGAALSTLNGRQKSVDQAIVDDAPKPATPKYEEYEQPPPSPWTQSPAPSPAVRADPTENPFFRDATVDEDSFNPTDTPEAYGGMRPPEAIGMDNSWSVLHIPLPHLVLSKQGNSLFKPDSGTAKIGSRVPRTGHVRSSSVVSSNRPASSESPRGEKIAPIAILSILSPVIPYPSNLRHSLEYLAPHLATSFSLARHHSNLEAEIAGLHRRRPDTTGFGAVDVEGRPILDPLSLAAPAYLPPEDVISQQSLGSITSPSDYSGPARSSVASPGLTPGWDAASLGQLLDKRASSSSPSQTMADGYFSETRGTLGKNLVASSGAHQTAPKRTTTDSFATERRYGCAPSSKPVSEDLNPSHATAVENEVVEERGANSQLLANDSFDAPQSCFVSPIDEGSDEEVQQKSAASKRRTLPDPTRLRTQLHSYGADFSTTAQSLPPSTPVNKHAHSRTTTVRRGSMHLEHSYFPYPSSALHKVILDLLPLQIFVALPQTGEIVWVNSRYLSYRGQSATGLKLDPYGALHPDDRSEYLKKWAQCVRTGTSLETDTLVQIRRFDGEYRRFAVRAVPIRDKRNVVTHFLGSFMDVHKQYTFEMEAKTKAGLEASEAKHRLLANLIPQIIFTATENEGITFANEQWLSYTGQRFEDALNLGFMDFVHPEDLAKCRFPVRPGQVSTPLSRKESGGVCDVEHSSCSSSTPTTLQSPALASTPNEKGHRSWQQSPSRGNSPSSSSAYESPVTDLAELARKGVIKASKDSNGRQSYTTEVRLRSRTGEYRWHLIRCVEIDNVDFGNGVSSYFGSATDINDHKLLEAKLKEAMDSKGRFLSNMSHEIRTPLIGISGMVSFLQDTSLTEEQRDYTSTIQTSAKSLLLIINDILDLSKVDAGMMKLSFEWFHTRSLIEDVNELVWTMAVSKGLELNYVVEQDVPSWVKGDRVRIRQVLLNVIGNAIKFTSEGEVFSHCRVFKDDSPSVAGRSDIMLEFSIIDTGRGFSEQEAELMFKPFSQIDGSSARQHGGSGLGLVISRQLVELHGGQMNGTAVPGQGSTFTFTAKFKLPTNDDHPDVSTTPQQVPLRQGLPVVETVKQVKAILSNPTSPTAELGVASPPTTDSSSSSNPSLQSGQHSPTTSRPSVSLVNAGLTRFSEAARASGQDLSQLKLEMSSGRSSPGTTPTSESTAKEFQPSMYSILIVCPQKYSRRAIKMHIEMTLPKDVPAQITSLATTEEARKLMTVEDPVAFTHVALNCPSDDEAIDLLDMITDSPMGTNTTVLILADSKQRQAVLKETRTPKYEKILSENRVFVISKPAKPSRFAIIFDPDKRGDLSFDYNRSRALQMVESQKQNYLEAERRMGNKGYKVLLVEDNLVNQKVLLKYLQRIGLEVEVANDGVEGTEKVFSHNHGFYSIILCDLHMPRKDGYQTCEEIRMWEKNCHHSEMPIIALSANVMSDVEEKCVAAGFSAYVTKPVDFGDLSTAMSKFF